MSRAVLPPGRADEHGFLFTHPGEAPCPLYDLLRLFAMLAEPGRRSASIMRLADASTRPTGEEIDALRSWPGGIAAVLAVDASYDRLDDCCGTALGRLLFRPIAPALEVRHRDVRSLACASDYEGNGTYVQQWLRRLDWRRILETAKRRDAAALALVAGHARFWGRSIIGTPSQERPAVLFEDALPDGGVCKLADLLTVLEHAEEDNQRLSASEVAEMGAGLPVPPGTLEIAAMRLWLAGLSAVVSAEVSYRRLIRSPSSMTLRQAFRPMAPVLTAYHAEVATSEEEAPVRRWLDQLGWSTLLRRAELRDEAALAIIQDIAEYDPGSDSIVSLHA